MKVVVTGSRKLTGSKIYKILAQKLYAVQTKYGKKITRLAAGEANGVDLLVKVFADIYKIDYKGYPVEKVDWSTYGKGAGVRRNSIMLETERPDVVVAIWDGESTGTLDCMTKATKLGIPVELEEIHVAKAVQIEYKKE